MNYLDLALAILSTMGTGAVLAAWIPIKIQKVIPGLSMILKVVGQNIREAKNSER
tara:strand:- start:2492 stop:2656 length:165 start_codon:yes stop_codon:yes gene_type:complete